MPAPEGNERAVLIVFRQSMAYLVFQLLRFTRMYLAKTFRELLPHVFTLIPNERDGYFLRHFL